MTFDFFEVLLLSAIQGISEFIPVSSSAHLFLTSEIYNFKAQSLLTDIGLHLGSLLAIITYFHTDLSNILKNKNLLLLIIIGSVPVILVGAILYQTNLISYLRNIEIIAWATLIFAIILYFADKVEVKRKFTAKLDFRTIIIIGCFQILALIPGVSRSGIVITAGRFLKFDRVNAAKISFLLSIPTLLAVSVFGIYNIYVTGNFNLIKLNFSSIIFSFIFSYITMVAFLGYIKKASLDVFVLYRLVLGVIILIFAYQG